MRGAVLLVLHFNGHDGPRERPSLPLLGLACRQQVGRQWGVQRVRQKDELKLDLKMLTYLFSFIKKKKKGENGIVSGEDLVLSLAEPQT